MIWCRLVVLFLLKFTFQNVVADTCSSLDACGKQKYVVYLGGKGEAADPLPLSSSHYALLSDVLGSEEEAFQAMAFSYTHSFSGFSAWLTHAQAKTLSGLPGVVSVFESELLQVQTTRSWNFIGLNTIGNSINSTAGEDIIIGILDTGIWPESVSFDDQGITPVPARWKGSCINNEVKYETEKVHCNKKLIGARSYTGGNARDYNGHGTHTSSTTVGRMVVGENLFGLGTGNATGGVPNARIAVYKVCDISKPVSVIFQCQ